VLFYAVVMSVNGSTSAIAASGLRAANTRIEVSAHNVANANTDGFDPQRVDQARLANGGTRASISQPDLSNPLYMRDGQLTEASGTDFTSETIEQMRATQAFKASIAVLRSSDQMLGSLFDATL
jgi:flagellar basal body rod protein FlgG